MQFSPAHCAIALCLIGSTLVAQEPLHRTFDDDPVDHAPAGFTLSAMRQPEAGRWLIERPNNDHNGCLAHRAKAGATGYGIAIMDARVPDDLAVTVRMRGTAGARGSGLVWRYRDHQNFYSLLLDLSRGELSVYRIASGIRVRLDVLDDLELDPHAWHTLKVVHVGSTMRVSLGGIRVFEEQDRRYEGRPAATGRVGVMASGNSDVWFDDLRAETKVESRQERR